MADDAPSIRTLAGQLAYLFEDEPGLRDASDDDLAARLNRNDRYARARETYPLHTDAEVEEKVSDYDDRITPAMVREARTQLPR